MRKSGVYQGNVAAQKLFITTASLPQVVFAIISLRTNQRLIRTLFPKQTQLCTQEFYPGNSLSNRIINSIHRPNNSSNEGE